MLTRRIIPCLDVKDGKVVKGVNFTHLVEEGEPVELGAWYSSQGADELVFLDISATVDAHRHVLNLARQVAKDVFIPFTIGGGIRTLVDMDALLSAGADKVAINTAALKNPSLISEAARQFGSQFIVVAIDVQKSAEGWVVMSHGGTQSAGRQALDWSAEAEDRGAGEILLTSIDADGTQQGIDCVITRRVSRQIQIPLIASGGIGRLEHFHEAFEKGEADAALAASVFHRRILGIGEVKDYLIRRRIPIRLAGAKP